MSDTKTNRTTFASTTIRLSIKSPQVNLGLCQLIIFLLLIQSSLAWCRSILEANTLAINPSPWIPIRDFKSIAQSTVGILKPEAQLSPRDQMKTSESSVTSIRSPTQALVSQTNQRQVMPASFIDDGAASNLQSRRRLPYGLDKIASMGQPEARDGQVEAPGVDYEQEGLDEPEARNYNSHRPEPQVDRQESRNTNNRYPNGDTEEEQQPQAPVDEAKQQQADEAAERREQEAAEASEAEAANKEALAEQRQAQREIILAQAQSEAKAIREQQEALMMQQRLQQQMLMRRQMELTNEDSKLEQRTDKANEGEQKKSRRPKHKKRKEDQRYQNGLQDESGDRQVSPRSQMRASSSKNRHIAPTSGYRQRHDTLFSDQPNEFPPASKNKLQVEEPQDDGRINDNQSDIYGQMGDSSERKTSLSSLNSTNLEPDSSHIDLSSILEPLAAAQHHYGPHYGSLHGHQKDFYQFAESHKKGQFDSGFKRGGKKLYSHSSQHKSHANGHVKWQAKKGKGSQYWDLKHKDKKHHHYDHH